MSKRIIQKTIMINAHVRKVWKVFTDPAITKKMGGEYVTDWKVGSSFGWKGRDGKMYTQGTILEIEKENVIKHNLLDDQKQNVLSVITYEFVRHDHQTMLHAQEELNYETTDEQCQDSVEGWDFALASVKR